MTGRALLLADSDVGKGSPIGLLVVLALVIAVYFLYRSMNRHLRNVPGKFDGSRKPQQAQRGPNGETPTEPGSSTEGADPTGGPVDGPAG
jgi:hypothetical protein